MALFGVVEEWLRAGHEIDFFSPGDFIDPSRLVSWPGFRYTRVEFSSWKRVSGQASRAVLRSKRGPAVLRSALFAGLNKVQGTAHVAELVERIRSEHRTRRYDAFISINRTSTDGLADVLPVVSWTQGPPAGEGEFIRREGAVVRQECGVAGWALLRAGYLIKDALAGRGLGASTGIIVASEWARSMWMRAGVPEDHLRVIPFPVDVDLFTASPRPAKADSFIFLWAGRIVPRKRFPLALEAFARLRARRPGARLLIAGGPGYQGLVSQYRLPPLGEGVERLGSVPSAEMPALLARTDVIFQPSENENFGAAPVEGLASGIPSVVGPTNGTSDCLEDTAFRFERHTPESIAGAMERAMDAVLADPRGVALRARALAEAKLATPVIAGRGIEAVAGFIDRWHAEKGAGIDRAEHSGQRPGRIEARPRES